MDIHSLGSSTALSTGAAVATRATHVPVDESVEPSQSSTQAQASRSEEKVAPTSTDNSSSETRASDQAMNDLARMAAEQARSQLSRDGAQKDQDIKV